MYDAAPSTATAPMNMSPIERTRDRNDCADHDRRGDPGYVGGEVEDTASQVLVQTAGEAATSPIRMDALFIEQDSISAYLHQNPWDDNVAATIKAPLYFTSFIVFLLKHPCGGTRRLSL